MSGEKSVMPAFTVPDNWTPEQIAQFQKEFDEIVQKNPKMSVRFGEVPALDLQSVAKLVDDWEQDYFSQQSWPPHTKAHIAAALSQLRVRIKGLIP